MSPDGASRVADGRVDVPLFEDFRNYPKTDSDKIILQPKKTTETSTVVSDSRQGRGRVAVTVGGVVTWFNKRSKSRVPSHTRLTLFLGMTRSTWSASPLFGDAMN